MAEPPQSISIVSQVNFRMKVQNISQLTEVDSPVFVIQDIPWRVHINKTNEKAEQSLAFYLLCECDQKSPEWTQPAVVSFKLLSFNGNTSAEEYHVKPYVFDRNGKRSGTSIRWDDLFDGTKHFVKDDAINLEVNINVADQNDENKCNLIFEGIDNCCERGRIGKFQLTVNNIANIMAIRSPLFKLRNVPWNLTLFKHESYLGLQLDDRGSTNEIIYNVSASVEIISSNDRMQTVQRIEAQQVRRKDGLVMERLISWDELIKPQNGFIDNGSVMLEIEINAERRQLMIRRQSIQLPRSTARRRLSLNAFAHVGQPRMECKICFEAIERQELSAITACGHMFCTTCITNSIQNRKYCPTCNVRVTKQQVKRIRLPIVKDDSDE